MGKVLMEVLVIILITGIFLILYSSIRISDGEGIASTPIHHGLAETLGFTEEQMFKLAAENTKRLLPPVIKSMNDVMRDIFMKDGMPPEIADMMLGEMPPEQQMYVISNNKGINGAVSMLYEDGLHDLSEKLGSDLYIMPSSIHNRSHWCRFSRRYEKGENGGSQIDFLRVFAGMDVKEAVFWLLDFAGYRRNNETQEKLKLKYQVSYKEEEKKGFVLPQPAQSNDYLYEYLTNDRAISTDVVNFFVKQGLIYESMPYHNIVFKGNDKDGVTRFASMRGVFDKQGKDVRVTEKVLCEAVPDRET